MNSKTIYTTIHHSVLVLCAIQHTERDAAIIRKQNEVKKMNVDVLYQMIKRASETKKSANTVQATESAGRNSCTAVLENTQECINSQKAEKINSC
jgi:hypothetical protein